MKKHYFTPRFTAFYSVCGMQLDASTLSENLFDNTKKDKFGANYDL